MIRIWDIHNNDCEKVGEIGGWIEFFLFLVVIGYDNYHIHPFLGRKS